MKWVSHFYDLPLTFAGKMPKQRIDADLAKRKIKLIDKMEKIFNCLGIFIGKTPDFKFGQKYITNWGSNVFLSGNFKEVYYRSLMQNDSFLYVQEAC